eukprot:1182613-Prorocentrum_minimum.AAC.1
MASKTFHRISLSKGCGIDATARPDEPQAERPHHAKKGEASRLSPSHAFVPSCGACAELSGPRGEYFPLVCSLEPV